MMRYVKKSADKKSLQLWVMELRKLSAELIKDISVKGAFHYWQRLFTKIMHTSVDDSITVNRYNWFP